MDTPHPTGDPCKDCGTCSVCGLHGPLVVDGPATIDNEHACEHCTEAFEADEAREEAKFVGGFKIFKGEIFFNYQLN